jgi:uncharacterized phage protein gp47/JayE
MGSFSDNGYERFRLDEWVTLVKDLYFSVFGSNIDLSDDTQDGQLAGAIAEAMSNQDQQTEDVGNSFDPNSATGNEQSTLVTLNGIKRAESTSSIVTLRLFGTDATTVVAGSLVRESENNEQFATDNDAVISAPYTEVSATAVNSGAIIASAATLTIIDSQTAGWDSVTNENDATVGEDEESDTDLRVRRRNSVAISSEGNQASVSGALKNLDDVISAIVKENFTSSIDSDGVDPHSIACVVEGGSAADIADTIWTKKSGGCDLFGSLTETVIDSDGFEQDIEYSRPTDVNIYVEVTVKELSDYPADGDQQIKDAIVAYFETDPDTRLAIGDDVIYSEVYNPCNSVEGASITNLTVDIVTPAVDKLDIIIAYNELARFDDARITVTSNP